MPIKKFKQKRRGGGGGGGRGGGGGGSGRGGGGTRKKPVLEATTLERMEAAKASFASVPSKNLLQMAMSTEDVIPSLIPESSPAQPTPPTSTGSSLISWRPRVW